MLGDADMPTLEQYGRLAYVTRAVCESMRLYPHPPVLLRRARVADTLPGGYEVRWHPLPPHRTEAGLWPYQSTAPARYGAPSRAPQSLRANISPNRPRGRRSSRART